MPILTDEDRFFLHLCGFYNPYEGYVFYVHPKSDFIALSFHSNSFDFNPKSFNKRPFPSTHFWSSLNKQYWHGKVSVSEAVQMYFEIEKAVGDRKVSDIDFSHICRKIYTEHGRILKDHEIKL